MFGILVRIFLTAELLIFKYNRAYIWTRPCGYDVCFLTMGILLLLICQESDSFWYRIGEAMPNRRILGKIAWKPHQTLAKAIMNDSWKTELSGGRWTLCQHIRHTSLLLRIWAYRPFSKWWSCQILPTFSETVTKFVPREMKNELLMKFVLHIDQRLLRLICNLITGGI